MLCLNNLNKGNPIGLYDGVTSSHPVYDFVKGWVKARNASFRSKTFTASVVYDVILEDPAVNSMEVEGVDVAVAGYPIPGMIHPYWGSGRVVDDVRSRYPD